MMNVQSQAGPGAWDGQSNGGERAAHRPGVGAALLAFGVLVLIAAASLKYMKERPAPLFEVSAESAASRIEALAVMGQKRVDSRAADFERAEAVGVMGSCILDLRQAKMTDDTAQVDAVAVMGHVDIIVPPDWIVVPDDVLTIGSLVNRARHSDVAEPRTVRLTGAVLLGTIRIRR